MKNFTYKSFSVLILAVFFSPFTGLHLDRDHSSAGNQERICFNLNTISNSTNLPGYNKKSQSCAPETLIEHLFKNGSIKNDNVKTFSVELKVSTVAFERLCDCTVYQTRELLKEYLSPSSFSLDKTVTPSRGPPQIL